MEYGRLGTTGATISRICLGMMTYGAKSWRPWVLEEDEARPFVQRAVEAGINFFDTADMYSYGESERITGKLLKEFARRDEVVIATKVFQPMSGRPNDGGLSRKHIVQGVEQSLKRLGVDYIDLYQIHRRDPHTPIEEVVTALDSLVQSGKVLYLGASSMFAWQFLKMLQLQQSNGLARFVTMQNHYNLVYREEEREMIPLCLEEGIGMIPWSPLARGFLAGRKPGEATVRAQTDDLKKSYYKESDYVVVERVEEVATARGVKPAQVALAWMFTKPVVSAPIIGASKMYQLDDAIAAVDIKLTDDEVKRLEEPYEPHRVLGHR
ncbi:Predicted oxidoreductase [Granulicella pectinivorans]|uniref:Predicted oxidoreductase n=1 Tax=Granulicella pectinivorans TaxID=474950 RepID=A0A1I6LF43_9BACT|nr:aldo/keto reductase [Granulicella pectinivorans]SFS02074.1 Predicted oxidoreductase [Granulicella pectinivorans]